MNTDRATQYVAGGRKKRDGSFIMRRIEHVFFLYILVTQKMYFQFGPGVGERVGAHLVWTVSIPSSPYKNW